MILCQDSVSEFLSKPQTATHNHAIKVIVWVRDELRGLSAACAQVRPSELMRWGNAAPSQWTDRRQGVAILYATVQLADHPTSKQTFLRGLTPEGDTTLNSSNPGAFSSIQEHQQQHATGPVPVEGRLEGGPILTSNGLRKGFT